MSVGFPGVVLWHVVCPKFCCALPEASQLTRLWPGIINRHFGLLSWESDCRSSAFSEVLTERLFVVHWVRMVSVFVMPWDPEADQQFTLVITMLLTTLRTQIAMEGIEASVPRMPPDEAILSARRGALATWNPDVSHVDDIALAIPVHADHANNTLRRTVFVLRRVFSAISILPNFSAEKKKPRLL